MVTRDEILQARARRDAANAARKAKEDAEYQQYLTEKLQKDMVSAITLLDGQLGKTIKEFEFKGITCFRTNGKSMEIRKGLGFSWHSDFSPITFAPDPTYAPTQALCAELKRAGFEFKLSTVQEKNAKMKWHGDGEYDVVETGGTHPVYWLEISW